MVATITKEEISKLPAAAFNGRIIVINTEKDVEKAIAYLSTFKRIGFDTETRPAFQKGKTHKMALMQLSTDDTCFLIRVNKVGFPECLLNFLTNPEVQKIGLSLKDDFSVIRRSGTFSLAGFIELQSFVKQFGIEETGLQRIYAILFQEKISKNQRLSNWESEILSESQQKYAALDAYACLRIYNKLEEIKEK